MAEEHDAEAALDAHRAKLTAEVAELEKRATQIRRDLADKRAQLTGFETAIAIMRGESVPGEPTAAGKTKTNGAAAPRKTVMQRRNIGKMIADWKAQHPGEIITVETLLRHPFRLQRTQAQTWWAKLQLQNGGGNQA